MQNQKKTITVKLNVLILIFLLFNVFIYFFIIDLMVLKIYNFLLQL